MRGEKGGCTENKEERDRDVWGKEKGASESENDNYIGKLEKAKVTCILGRREYKFLVHSFSLSHFLKQINVLYLLSHCVNSL
jgi:hypothetical protein